MEGHHGGDHDRKIPDHVAQYLARRALHNLPAGAYDVLLSLTPEELEVLERVGAALDGCEPHHVAFAIH